MASDDALEAALANLVAHRKDIDPALLRGILGAVTVSKAIEPSEQLSMEDAFEAIDRLVDEHGWFLAMIIGSAAGETLTRRRIESGAPAGSGVVGPTFEEIVSEAGLSDVRPPSVKTLHRAVQVGLLERIQKLIGDATSIEELDQLTAAYLRLPSPDEDHFD